MRRAALLNLHGRGVRSYDGVDDRSVTDQHRSRFDVCSDWPEPRVIGVKRLSLTIEVMIVRRWVGYEPG